MSTTDSQNEADTLLSPLIDTNADILTQLHTRLVTESETAGLLDIAYHTTDTPVGKLLLAATEKGLVRVAYQSEDHDRVLQALADKVSPRVLKAPKRLDPVVEQLDEYFTGERTQFDLPLDLTLSGGFRKTVLEHLPEIPYGHTESYSEVAKVLGNPKAVRAVGSACANNPLPVVVPCHRVLRSDGTLGGYLGGLKTKQTLLSLEAAAA
ncbi:MAG: methylated-DNA--[protein]-cysteine S-methyltransferase [Acidimicrobiia bacterium]|nr:methylated-DNA--[protein]-cysteine S-methyltransferase [Acidimicrobiia bacterium]